MSIYSSVGPTVQPSQPGQPDWPIYPCLETHLLTRPGDLCSGCGDEVGDPDRKIAHTLAVIAAYAYARVDSSFPAPDTMARMASHLGLEESTTVCVKEQIDASFVLSTGFLITSASGKVAILCYRGTEPYSLPNWMTDADIDSEARNLRVDGQAFPVHPGFYRNMRAIDLPLLERLRSAADGGVLEAVYVTGHSLGGAMAAMNGLLLLNDPARETVREKLRSIYTYGQPMIGGPTLADQMAKSGHDERFHRFVYEKDVVPWAPPKGAGRSVYRHFGRSYHLDATSGEHWKKQGALPPEVAIKQTSVQHFLAAFVNLLTVKLPKLDDAIGRLDRFVDGVPVLNRFDIRVGLTIGDHLPLRYVRALADPDSLSEFGEYPVLTSR
jgi:hypothetical protein